MNGTPTVWYRWWAGLVVLGVMLVTLGLNWAAVAHLARRGIGIQRQSSRFLDGNAGTFWAKQLQGPGHETWRSRTLFSRVLVVD